jgi:hypothetical protein
VNPFWGDLLIAAGIPTVAVLLSQWRAAAVSDRRHAENSRRLDAIEKAMSIGPDGAFVSRREFDQHVEADSERLESILEQLSDIRRLLNAR